MPMRFVRQTFTFQLRSTLTSSTARSVLFAWLFAFSLGVARGADWPCYRGPNKDGISPERIATWPPQEVWRANVGSGYSQVAVSEGRVYTMGWNNNQDTVYCFSEASTGNNPTAIWTQSYACGTVDYLGPRGTPTVDGNEVYTFSHEGRLSCFDRVTGTPLWNKSVGYGGRPGWGFGSSPLVEGNLVIVNAGDHGKAVDKTHPGSHNIVWGTDGGGSGYASPFAFTRGTQRTVVIFSNPEIHGVDPANGNVLWWTQPFGGGEGMADPIINGDRVWGSKGYGAGCGVANLGTGQLQTQWSNQEMRNKENCSVLYNGYVYGIDESGELRCVEFATGIKKWGAGGFGTESAVAMAGDEIVAISSANANLVVVQTTPTAHNELHRMSTGITGDTWIAPVIANGRLYIRSHTGNLVVYSVGSDDQDADGLPDVWETGHGLCPTNAADAEIDSDGDGAKNSAEYLAGTDPTNAQSCLRTRLDLTNGRVLVNCPMLTATGAGYEGKSRYYTLETEPSVLTSNWQAAVGCSNVLGNDSVLAYTNAVRATGGFFRVKARLQ